MTPFFDMFPVDADEFIMNVVRKDDCRWLRYATFPTLDMAYQFLGGMDKKPFRLIGIQPQNSEMYPFQTHPNQVVYEA